MPYPQLVGRRKEDKHKNVTHVYDHIMLRHALPFLSTFKEARQLARWHVRKALSEVKTVHENTSVLTLNGDIIMGGANSACGENMVVGSCKPLHLSCYLITIIGHYYHLIGRLVSDARRK